MTTPMPSASSPATISQIYSAVAAAAAQPSQSSALATAVAETVPAWGCATTFTPTTAIAYIYSVRLDIGTVVGHVGYLTYTTAGTTMANQWMCLADSQGTVRAVTADQGTAAIPASTWASFAVGTAYTAAYTGQYYLGLMIKATTLPTLVAAASPQATFVTGTSVPGSLLGGASSTAQASPPALGSALIAPTAVTAIPYLFAAP